ncbi:MAG: hypothetical protein KBC32_06195 [Candidatus Didemnitutus sp.]|nr:hypothetical protein [Candidatus Didemnitutus sp.]
MKAATATPSFFVGWDVGGWNCDKNAKSRDAIVVLDFALNMVGQPWRGNLRECISTARTTRDWLKALFTKCKAELPEGDVKITMAIDTPLGFSSEFVSLITRQVCVEPDATSGRNRYLFRQTERDLFERGLKPLSAIKDMIGSQATKGMHALAKFAPQIKSCGVWTDGQGFCAIESYPAVAGKSPLIKRLLRHHKSLHHRDQDDARVCAVVAQLFSQKREALAAPTDDVPRNEGWIWIPQDIPNA